MLCRRLKNILFVTSLKKIPHSRCKIQTQFRVNKRRLRYHDEYFSDITKCNDSMSTLLKFRRIFRDLGVARLWGVCRRSFLVGTVFRRYYKEDHVVKNVVRYFRYNFFRPGGAVALSVSSVAAAYKPDDDDFTKCSESITDEELEAAAKDIDMVDELSLKTLFCSKCDRRLVVDKKLPGIIYCGCKDGKSLQQSHDGWTPFMEAEDVIIWRKEYRNKAGAYVYKVYGRYTDVRAEDFAAIQVDGDYRTNWDTAVAGLIVIDKEANGLKDQAVLHWEVLWPKLFQNRDYVYIRRHKDFDIKTKVLQHKSRLFNNALTVHKEPETKIKPIYHEMDSVHSKAKKCVQAWDEKERIQREDESNMIDNKVYIILSRSCEHPDVPPNQNVIRVTEYWSHMVVRTLEGSDKPGMEFVLTYFDAPGGLPTSVSAWATGRAAPCYLDKQKRAAKCYSTWLRDNEKLRQTKLKEMSNEIIYKDILPRFENEIKNCDDVALSNQSKETETPKDDLKKNTNSSKENIVKSEVNDKETVLENNEKNEQNNTSWWKYFYPLYYFM